jgi:hypothetical protein
MQKSRRELQDSHKVTTIHNISKEDRELVEMVAPDKLTKVKEFEFTANAYEEQHSQLEQQVRIRRAELVGLLEMQRKAERLAGDNWLEAGRELVRVFGGQQK